MKHCVLKITLRSGTVVKADVIDGSVEIKTNVTGAITSLKWKHYSGGDYTSLGYINTSQVDAVVVEPVSKSDARFGGPV